MLIQAAERVQHCLFDAEVGGGSLKVLRNDVEVVLKIVTDLDLARLADPSDLPDEGPDQDLRVEWILLIHLHPHILNWVFLPEVKLVLTDEHQRKGDFVQDHVDVLLNHLASHVVLHANLHGPECAT